MGVKKKIVKKAIIPTAVSALVVGGLAYDACKILPSTNPYASGAAGAVAGGAGGLIGAIAYALANYERRRKERR